MAEMVFLTKLKPEPMGRYDASTAYGINSLVMREDGAAAYISVKDVPAGTPLTNDEYWKVHTDLSGMKPGGGIYVGPEEPEDPNVQVWIDNDGEAVEIPEPYTLPTASETVKGGVKVGNGLQMNGDALEAVPEGVYELIETITVDEPISAIERTQEPDGTAYNFICLYFKCAVKATAENVDGLMNIFLNGRSGFCLTVSGAVKNRDTWSTPYAWIEHGTAMGMSCIAALYSYGIQTTYMPAYQRTMIKMKSFTELQIDIPNALPVGSTIEIWGVRANA